MGSSFNFEPVFRVSELDLVIHDLVGGNTSYIDDYLTIYTELFPQYARYAAVMRQRAERSSDGSANEIWHQWLLLIKDEPIGIIGFLYNGLRNTGFLLDFAIKPEARRINFEGKRLAYHCLDLAMQQLILDAQGRGCSAPLCMIAEVEFDALVKRYAEYGFLVFPYEYFEPPTTPELRKASAVLENLDKIGYERMYLGAFQIPGRPFSPNDPHIINAVICTVLKDHYQLPDNHWLVQKILRQVIE